MRITSGQLRRIVREQLDQDDYDWSRGRDPNDLDDMERQARSERAMEIQADKAAFLDVVMSGWVAEFGAEEPDERALVEDAVSQLYDELEDKLGW
ncbi:MAG TPA: hypothetical protein EYG51_22090 [Pseudomonadales bacterium]|nr:hypothetical protein [Pseudomonadales bacterium]